MSKAADREGTPHTGRERLERLRRTIDNIKAREESARKGLEWESPETIMRASAASWSEIANAETCSMTCS